MKSENKVFLGDKELTLDEQIELAEFDLFASINKLNELLAERNARDLDIHIEKQYQEYLEIQEGKAIMESDKADAEIDHAIAVKYLENNPTAHTKVVPTDGSFAFGDLVLVDEVDGEEMQLGKIAREDTQDETQEVSADIPF